MSTQGSTRAIVAAASANLFIAVTKFAAYLLTGAASMLAESIHSLADTANQALLMLGGRNARREATELHPFGFGRSRYVAAFMVSIILFSLGGLFALYEAFHKFEEVSAGHPNDLLESRWWWVPLLVLGVAIVAESFSLRTAVHESQSLKGRQSWARFIRTSRNPELPVVLLEDVAALIGLAFALLGVGMTLLTHNGYWDVAGTALIGALLIAVAVTLAIETRSLLIGESATPEAVARIRDAIEATPGVTALIHMKTLHLGPEEILVAAKFATEPTQDAATVAATIDRAEAAVRDADPMVGPVYLEPAILIQGRADAAR